MFKYHIELTENHLLENKAVQGEFFKHKLFRKHWRIYQTAGLLLEDYFFARLTVEVVLNGMAPRFLLSKHQRQKVSNEIYSPALTVPP